jgi:hypothetical protein
MAGLYEKLFIYYSRRGKTLVWSEQAVKNGWENGG